MPVVPTTEFVPKQSYLQITPAELAAREVNLLGLDIENLLTDYRSAELFPGVAEHTEELLAARSLGVVLMTNSGRTHDIQRVISQLPGNLTYLNPNSELGLRKKPSPTMFNRARELFGVRPENAAHVDDQIKAFWGARAASYGTFFWTEPAGENQHWLVEKARPLEHALGAYYVRKYGALRPHPAF